MPRALLIGDVMTDIAARLEGPIAVGSDRRARIVERPGGSAATQAVWLARFGVGVDFVGRVGAGDLAAQSAILSRAGVAPHLAGDRERETGRLIAIVDPSGERSFLTDRGANDALAPGDIPDALIARADLIHLSGYSFLAPSSREAMRSVFERAAGRCPVSVDPASGEFLREVGAENFLKWTAGAAILIPNAEEAATLAGTDDEESQGRRLGALYPLVAIKRGSSGAEAWRDGERTHTAATKIDVVDTTGAGDAFAAAFLAAHLDGIGLAEALGRAVAAGAEAATYLGGRPAS